MRWKYLLLIIFGVALVAAGWWWGRPVLSYWFYLRGVGQMSSNLSKAEDQIKLARRIFVSDLYDRALVEIILFKLNHQPSSNEIITWSQQAIDLAAEATTINPADYRNWLSRARLYQVLAAGQVAGAVVKAAEFYLAACERIKPSDVDANALTEICYADQTSSH